MLWIFDKNNKQTDIASQCLSWITDERNLPLAEGRGMKTVIPKGYNVRSNCGWSAMVMSNDDQTLPGRAVYYDIKEFDAPPLFHYFQMKNAAQQQHTNKALDATKGNKPSL